MNALELNEGVVTQRLEVFVDEVVGPSTDSNSNILQVFVVSIAVAKGRDSGLLHFMGLDSEDELASTPDH